MIAGLVGMMIWQQPTWIAFYYKLSVSPGTPVAFDAARAVLYEEDPDNPRGRSFTGSAVWRTDSVPSGTNEPPDIVVRGDIEIPDRKMSVAWMLRHDLGGVAGHTIEMLFMLPPDFPDGDILKVPGIWMKSTENATGIPVVGFTNKVSAGYFLIGLSAAPGEQARDVQILKDRPWFEMPIVYTNNRRAILAVNKGISGDNAFKQAFAVWEK
jgi:hypothetical protein